MSRITMKRSLRITQTPFALVGCLLVVLHGRAAFADPGLVQPGTVNAHCTISDNPTTPVYIFLRGTDGALSVRYSAPIPTCSNWILLNESNQLPAVGSAAAGIEFTFEECVDVGVVDDKLLLQVLTFAGGSSSPSCCLFIVQGFPGDELPIPMLETCDNEPEYARGAAALIERIPGTCPCGSELMVPVEPSTWGAIKELWAN